MKIRTTKTAILTTLLTILSGGTAYAQSPTDGRPVDPDTRPRSVVISAQQRSSATTPNPAAPGKTANTPADWAAQRPGSAAEKPETPRPLSPAKIRTRISEVKRLMRSRPSITAITSPALD